MFHFVTKRIIASCLTIIAVLLSVEGKSQFGDSGPKLTVMKGQPCPPFSFSDVENYVKSTLNLDDLKGKPAIIDFFGSWCSVCFRSFPKLAEMRNKFAGQINVILVGRLDSTIKRVYKKFDDRYKLNFPVAYDSNIFNTWQIVSAPYEVWLNEAGIVQAVTTSTAVTESNIQALLAHQPIDAPLMMNFAQNLEDPLNMDWTKPFEVHGNGGDDSDFLYRSMLSRWRIGQAAAAPGAMYHVLGNRCQAMALSLNQLYQLAYADTMDFAFPQPPNDFRFGNHYGEWSLHPELKMKDKTLFTCEYAKGINVFNYSLIGPIKAASAYHLQKAMQRDLKTYFGYNVSIEDREVDCWEIHATQNAQTLFKSKGGIYECYGDNGGFRLRNAPITDLIAQISAVHQGDIFIDRTGIGPFVDIHVDAIMTDFDELKKVLESKGLTFVSAKTRVKCVVITDDQDPN